LATFRLWKPVLNAPDCFRATDASHLAAHLPSARTQRLDCVLGTDPLWQPPEISIVRKWSSQARLRIHTPNVWCCLETSKSTSCFTYRPAKIGSTYRAVSAEPLPAEATRVLVGPSEQTGCRGVRRQSTARSYPETLWLIAPAGRSLRAGPWLSQDHRNCRTRCTKVHKRVAAQDGA
jgi:hypothetical protein